jgi:citrate synthase
MLSGAEAHAQANVTQEHNNSSRDGVYIDAVFTLSAAENLTRDLNLNGIISGNVYAQPLKEEAAVRTLATMREAGERMPGFGHRVDTKDPRTARLFELAREAGIDGAHMQAACAVEKAFADAKKSLPINVDGAIGAILADLGMNLAAFNGIFMIARTPGLIAHVIEEQTREKPMRRIDPVNHGYDGPPSRSLSGKSSS